MVLGMNQNVPRIGQLKSKPRRRGTPFASRWVSFSATAGTASQVFGQSLSGSRPASRQIALLAKQAQLLTSVGTPYRRLWKRMPSNPPTYCEVSAASSASPIAA